MTLCDAETRRVSDRTAKGDGSGAESVSVDAPRRCARDAWGSLVRRAVVI